MAINEDDSSSKLENLYHEHKDIYFRYLFRMSGCRETAEDLLHDAFILMASHFSRLKNVQKFKSWGFCICLNTFRTWYRRNKNSPIANDGMDSFSDTRSGQGMCSEEANALSLVIEKFKLELNELDRSIFVLSHWQNMPYKEIASILSVSERTIKRKMKDIVGRLAGILRDSRLVIGDHFGPEGGGQLT